MLHVHTGSEWLLPKLGEENQRDAVANGWKLRASTVGVLGEYEQYGDQRNWWPEFVREVLGRETAVAEFDLTRT